MMPAAKHGDPQLGVDIHLCIVPPGSPVPLPTPHIAVVFDPFDYIPFIGATTTVMGMKRASAGTAGMVVHIPPGFPFAKPPEKDDELFMGSSTVIVDGEPFSHIAHPALGCQVVGMPSPGRTKSKPKKMCLLPTDFNLAIPSTVLIGGPPTISMMGLATKGAFKALGALAKKAGPMVGKLLERFKGWRQAKWGHLPSGFLKCVILRAEPVDILTGAVSVEQQDFALPGRLPLAWLRSYSSASTRDGLCGVGWETPADGRLEVDPASGIVGMYYPGVGPLYFDRLPRTPGEAGAEAERDRPRRMAEHEAPGGAAHRHRERRILDLRLVRIAHHAQPGGSGHHAHRGRRPVLHLLHRGQPADRDRGGEPDRDAAGDRRIDPDLRQREGRRLGDEAGRDLEHRLHGKPRIGPERMTSLLKLARTLRTRDDGVALPTVFGLSLLMLVLVASAMTVSTRGIVKTNTDEDTTGALAAAYAGVEEYQSRLANDSNYQKFGNPAAPFSLTSAASLSLPTGSNANPAFGIGASGTWANIPGEPLPDGTPQQSPGWFRYEVSNVDYADKGVLHLRVTGRVGDVTRSIVADLRRFARAESHASAEFDLSSLLPVGAFVERAARRAEASHAHARRPTRARAHCKR
mgnify:CR=1 FL=1